MNNLVFHNNYHRSNHHTVSLASYPESAKDPIASLKFPFLGTFYNNYYNTAGNYIGTSNSYEWKNAYTLTKSNSSVWEKSFSTYTTTQSNSGVWNIDVYTPMLSLSANWQSTYLTFVSNLNYWNAVYDTNTVFSNKVQEYTRQKTSKNISIAPSDAMNIVLDLSAGQVTTYMTEVNSKFSGFKGHKSGGIYHLILITDARSNSDLTVKFNSYVFLFPNCENTYTYNNGIYMRKFQFLCDGVFLHGKSDLYQLPS